MPARDYPELLCRLPIFSYTCRHKSIPMKILGTEGMTVTEINDELSRGARFVLYQYCVSVIIMTFKRSSDIYFVKSHENAVVKGLSWTLLSSLLGWWGIPWGPIYTVGSLATNLKGGKDVTKEVLRSLNNQSPGL